MRKTRLVMRQHFDQKPSACFAMKEDNGECGVKIQPN